MTTTGQASNNGTGASTLTMTLPAGVADDNVMLMTITARGGTGTEITSVPTNVSTFDQGDDGGAGENYASPNGAFVYMARSTMSVVRVLCTADNTILASPSIGTAGVTFGVFSPDSSMFYCLQYTEGTVVVIRTSDHTVVTTVSVGINPIRGAISSDGAYLYLVANNNTVVKVFRTSDNTVSATVSLTTGSNFGHIAITPSGAYAYVVGVSHVAVVRLSDNSLVTTISTSGTTAATSIAITPDGAYVYAGQSGFVSAIRTSDNTVVQSFSFTDPRFIFATSGSASVYVVSYGASGGASKITVSSQTVTATFAIYLYPLNCQISSSGQIYLANPNANTIQIINTISDTLSTLDIGYRSNSIALAGSAVYTVNSTTRTAAVLGQTRWIQLSRVNSTTTLAQWLFWAVASSEPASYVVTFSGSVLASGVILALTAASAVIPTSAQFAGQANGSSTSVAAPGLGTWTSGNGVDLGLFGTAVTSSFTAPTNYTEPSNSDSASTGGSTATTSEGAYRALTGVTTVGSITATAANAAVNIGHHVFIFNASQYVLDLSLTKVEVEVGANTTTDCVTTAGEGTAETVTFSSAWLPTGTTVSFDPTNVTAGGTSVATVTLDQTAAEGDTYVNIIATSPTLTKTKPLKVKKRNVPTPVKVPPLGGSL